MQNGQMQHSRYSVSTLGEWMDVYFASGEIPHSAKRNVRSVFKRFAEILSGQSDPFKVSIWETRGLLDAWGSYIDTKREAGEIKGGTGEQYRTLGKKCILWAQDHLKKMPGNPGIGPEIMLESTVWQSQLMTELSGKWSKPERRTVQRFFRFLHTEGIECEPDFVQALAWTEQFWEHLCGSGQKIESARKTYRDMVSGLNLGMKQGLIPDVKLWPLPSKRNENYAISWPDLPNLSLRAVAFEFHQKACDKTLTADEWPHKPFKPNTRYLWLRALGQYIGTLEGACDIRTESLGYLEIFSRENLKKFVEVYKKRQGGKSTGGLETTMKQLRLFACRILDIPKARFENLVETPDVFSGVPKSLRTPTVDEWWATLEAMRLKILKERNPINRVCLERLRVMVYLLLLFPMRSDNLLKLKMEHNLFKEPISRRWQVVLYPEQTKQKQKVQISLPDFFRPVLETYINDIRPRLLGKNASDLVFPTKTGKPVSRSSFWSSITKWDCRVRNVPQACAGFPHVIRDSVALACIGAMPDVGAHVASTLLGHNNPSTLRKHYVTEFAWLQLMAERDIENILEKETLDAVDFADLVATIGQIPMGLEHLKYRLRQMS